MITGRPAAAGRLPAGDYRPPSSRRTVTNMTKEELKKHMKQWDSSQWRKEVQSKATLTTYYAWKEDLEEEQFLDNHPSSIVFFIEQGATVSH